MRLLVLSDLHLELGTFEVPMDIAFDVVVLAGDIHNPGEKVVHWARRLSVFGETVPILVVPGNHEFYHRTLHIELAAMRSAAQGTNVHVLSEDEVLVGEVRFLAPRCGRISRSIFVTPGPAEMSWSAMSAPRWRRPTAR